MANGSGGGVGSAWLVSFRAPTVRSRLEERKRGSLGGLRGGGTVGTKKFRSIISMMINEDILANKKIPDPEHSKFGAEEVVVEVLGVSSWRGTRLFHDVPWA